jgi:hypothetical protein
MGMSGDMKAKSGRERTVGGAGEHIVQLIRETTRLRERYEKTRWAKQREISKSGEKILWKRIQLILGDRACTK